MRWENVRQQQPEDYKKGRQMTDHRVLMQELLLENAELHRTVYDARIGSNRETKEKDGPRKEDATTTGRR